ncbi:hypothetical protein EDB81DRAFT_270028 [Dactylonectria macrodidyma]|uniref:Uncharacterized protein n=1 Tax=Dactylonectria macrodidyma TaxID=307937 RepID=A0A9P9FP75_9HYPO|nr:hypothetical protein EDB81DRAFT_270028 [Dactylonectria macrodidyma]
MSSWPRSTGWRLFCWKTGSGGRVHSEGECKGISWPLCATQISSLAGVSLLPDKLLFCLVILPHLSSSRHLIVSFSHVLFFASPPLFVVPFSSLITQHSSHTCQVLNLSFHFHLYMLESFLLFILGRAGAGEPAEGKLNGEIGAGGRWSQGVQRENLSPTKAGLYILFALLSGGGASGLRSLTSPVCLAFHKGQPYRTKKRGRSRLHTTHLSSCLYRVIGGTWNWKLLELGLEGLWRWRKKGGNLNRLYRLNWLERDG